VASYLEVLRQLTHRDASVPLDRLGTIGVAFGGFFSAKRDPFGLTIPIKVANRTREHRRLVFAQVFLVIQRPNTETASRVARRQIRPRWGDLAGRNRIRVAAVDQDGKLAVGVGEQGRSFRAFNVANDDILSARVAEDGFSSKRTTGFSVKTAPLASLRTGNRRDANGDRRLHRKARVRSVRHGMLM
jgi:hypothetical protein